MRYLGSIMLTFKQGGQVLFQAGCLMLAGYMSCQQFAQYILNDDSSILGYRKFNESPKDVYPAFTVCITSYDGGTIFKDENFY